MEPLVWVLIGLGVLIIVAVAAFVLSRRRSQRLRERFGPEYDRTAEQADSRRAAESHLAAREKRIERLDIRPLSKESRDEYARSWRESQARFVDQPADAVRDADRLVILVMRERGYPMEEFDQRASDISVDHPNVVDNYRAAHAISMASDHGQASTEDLRQAMVHYRSLFEELIEVNEQTVGPREERDRVIDQTHQEEEARRYPA
jgi:hypothetical protein